MTLREFPDLVQSCGKIHLKHGRYHSIAWSPEPNRKKNQVVLCLSSLFFWSADAIWLAGSVHDQETIVASSSWWTITLTCDLPSLSCFGQAYLYQQQGEKNQSQTPDHRVYFLAYPCTCKFHDLIFLYSCKVFMNMYHIFIFYPQLKHIWVISIF